MFAELRTSREATFVERIDAIEEKSGTSGPLLFVTIQCSIEQDGAEVGTEKRTLVYLDPPGPVAMPKVQPFIPPEHREISCEWRPQTQELFRYSALTYNGHRIHLRIPQRRRRLRLDFRATFNPVSCAHFREAIGWIKKY
jgi:3-methylfumaryl-CoA hydratase